MAETITTQLSGRCSKCNGDLRKMFDAKRGGCSCSASQLPEQTVAIQVLDACMTSDSDYLEAHKNTFTLQMLTYKSEDGTTPLSASIVSRSLTCAQFLLDRTVPFGDTEISLAEKSFQIASGESEISSSREILRLLRELKKKDTSVDYWNSLMKEKDAGKDDK